MTTDQARQLRKLLEAQTDAMPDERILEYPDFVEKWKAGMSYAAGKRLEYNGTIYKVNEGQGHISQSDWTPDTTPSLYAKVLIPDPGEIPEWEQPDSTNGYSTGDKVTRNNKTWESLVDNNIWEPGVVGTENLWQEVTE